MQPCYWEIALLPGLSKIEQELLIKNNIKTTKDLLSKFRTSEEKRVLSSKLQLHIKHINKWVALADLGRIKSVNHQYCGLLLHSGIASVTQLAQTHSQRLHPAIKRLCISTMQRKDLAPSVTLVQKWIEEAKLLVRIKTF